MQAITGMKRENALGRNVCLLAILPGDLRARKSRRAAAEQAPGAGAVAILAQSHGQLAAQNLHLALDPQPTAPSAGAGRAGPQGVAVDAQRIAELERLRRHVHGVGDVGLERVDAIALRLAAGPAG